MQMRLKRITGLPAEANYLSLFHRVTDIHQRSIFLKMPIACSRAVGMLNDNVVTVLPVFFSPAAAVAIFFYPHNYAVSCSTDPCPSLHVEVKGYPFFVTEFSEISLHQP